jgi:hypothetical protein
MTNDNVTLFPKTKKGSPPQSLEEIKAKVIENRLMHINHIVDMSMHNIMNILFGEDVEIDLDDPIFMSRILYMAEIFKAILYAQMGEETPMLKDIDDKILITDQQIDTIPEGKRIVFVKNKEGPTDYAS